MSSAPRTARARVREELTAEILAAARENLAREGAAALSLRSVARDLGMAPSALYRYFDGRDALLGALILSAYESLADEAERAAAAAATRHVADRTRWPAVPRAMRAWALGRPHEWGLVFGTPVPGYEAPRATVKPYGRIAAAMSAPLVAAEAAGRLSEGRPRATTSPALRAAVAPVADTLPGLAVEIVVLALQAWSTVVGLIGLEVFGHWRNTVLDPAALFDAVLDDLAAAMGLA